MRNKRSPYLWVINAFIILVVFVLIGTMYLTLASATIQVPTGKEQFTTSTTLDVTATSTEAMLRGTIVTKEYTDSDSFAVGTAKTTSDKAGGMVNIINNASRDQVLIATTRLLSPDGKLFRIQNRVLVPARGSVSTFIEADQSGNEFLIDSSRFTIPGLSTQLQELIFAESTSAMTFDRLSEATVTQENINEADVKLTERMITRALDELNADLPDDQKLSKDQLAVKRTSLSATPDVGATAEVMNVSLTLSVTALIIDTKQIQREVGKKLRNELPDQNSFIEFIPGSLSYTITSIDTELGTAQISTTLSAWIRSNAVVSDIDTRQLTGKTIREAYDYVLNQGIQGAKIKLFPAWLPSLPLLESKIRIVTE